jgi:UDP-N-acetylmuramoylalanine--D-glutamate ligase
MQFNNKRVTVVGLGNSGVNAAKLLRSRGAEVFATDSGDTVVLKKTAKDLENAGCRVEIGGHTEAFIKNSDLVVISPGIENSSPALKWARQHRIRMIGEMELGYRFCRGRIIAITGTNGKSTVTTLVGQILKDAGKDAVVCGNIGNSLCGEISRINENTWVVLEVSSFQLESIDKFRPYIAVILNITDDHMDRYSKLSDYRAEKLKIFRNQAKDDILILNGDAAELKELEKMAASKVMLYKKEGSGVFETSLKGTHNYENIIVSRLIGSLAGVDDASIRRTVKSFKALSHRFETVRVKNGVEYIDDSKGTTVDSTLRALQSCDRPVILIAGGKDKHSDYGYVRKAVADKAKAVILIGEAALAIRKALAGATELYDAADMASAVRKAGELARSGEIVLLSPMCSSFDMFSSYKERGDVFRKAVEALRPEREEIKT